jgi:hypothetical protein
MFSHKQLDDLARLALCSARRADLLERDAFDYAVVAKEVPTPEAVWELGFRVEKRCPHLRRFEN